MRELCRGLLPARDGLADLRALPVRHVFDCYGYAGVNDVRGLRLGHICVDWGGCVHELRGGAVWPVRGEWRVHPVPQVAVSAFYRRGELRIDGEAGA